MAYANGISNKPAYKFGVELEMFVLFKSEPSDISEEETAKGQLAKAADGIARLYNEAISQNPPPGESGVRYPTMTRPDWGADIIETHPTRWEINTSWEIHDESSLYMFGIQQCDGCKW